MGYSRELQVLSAIIFAISIVIAVGCHHHLKDKSEKVRKAPLILISLAMVVIEVLKQVYNFTGYNPVNLIPYLQNHTSDGFDPYQLPLHFCSFFVFFGLLSLITKGKEKDVFSTLTFLWATCISLFMIIIPDSIYGGEARDIAAMDGIRRHSVFFHFLVFLYFCIEIALHTSKFEKKKWWYGIIAFSIYALVAIPFAFIFDTNYCSIIEPANPAPWLPWAFSKGYFVYEIVLILSGMAFGIATYFGILGVRYLDSKIKNPLWVECGFLGLAACLMPIQLIIEKCSLNNLLFLPFILIAAIICMAPAIVKTIVDKKSA